MHTAYIHLLLSLRLFSDSIVYPIHHFGWLYCVPNKVTLCHASSAVSRLGIPIVSTRIQFRRQRPTRGMYVFFWLDKCCKTIRGTNLGPRYQTQLSILLPSRNPLDTNKPLYYIQCLTIAIVF